MSKIGVFIAWSGDRSKAVAQALYQWLPNVIQGLDPWMSEDIEKGKRWALEISTRLEKSQLGIICVTSENRDAAWINFEAGALSKQLDTSRVCPYLLDLSPTELQFPLASFQLTRAEREDTRRLLQTFNKAMGEEALKEAYDGP